VLLLFTKGFPTACLLSNQTPVVHQKALKAMHTLFDMEVGTCTHSCMSHLQQGLSWAQPAQPEATMQHSDKGADSMVTPVTWRHPGNQSCPQPAWLQMHVKGFLHRMLGTALWHAMG
jgi:hypothetical protein